MANGTNNKKTWKPALALGTLLVILAVLAIIFFTGGERERVRRLAGLNVPKPQPPAVKSEEMKTVTLFFLSDDDDLLHRETPALDPCQEIGKIGLEGGLSAAHYDAINLTFARFEEFEYRLLGN